MAKSFGASGSLLNHSEHRLGRQTIRKLIERLRSLQMTSVVCAKTPDEVASIAKFRPDFIAIEPPELIGSGKAVSKHNPSLITRSVEAKARYSSSTKLNLRRRNCGKNRCQQRSSTWCRGDSGSKWHSKITLLERENLRIGFRI